MRKDPLSAIFVGKSTNFWLGHGFNRYVTNYHRVVARQVQSELWSILLPVGQPDTRKRSCHMHPYAPFGEGVKMLDAFLNLHHVNLSLLHHHDFYGVPLLLLMCNFISPLDWVQSLLLSPESLRCLNQAHIILHMAWLFTWLFRCPGSYGLPPNQSSMFLLDFVGFSMISIIQLMGYPND